MCRWPVLGMPWGIIVRSNAASAVGSRSGGACTGGCSGSGQVVCWGCGFCLCVENCRGRGSTQQPQRTEPCHCVSGQPWAYHGALQGQIQPLQCAAGVVEPVLGAYAGLDRWFVGGAVLLNAGVFQMWRRWLPTTAHRALPVHEWPALGMPWGAVRSSAASVMFRRSGGACTGG